MTASAALESRKYTPASTFVDPGYCIVYGKRVNNFDTSRPFGTLSLATALQHSVNSVFCNIGLALGAKRILKQAKAFGFYERPPLETPGERAAAERPLPQRAGSTTRSATATSTRAGWRSARSGCS